MSPKLLIGQAIGKYRITQMLGEGGLATVYQAYDPTTLSYVAIQVLRPEISQDSQARKKFKQQNEIFIKLRHPNIISIFDYGEIEGIAFSVSRFLTSTTSLANIISDKQLHLDEIDHILRQIAFALDHVHTQGVVHRDVKPINILVDENHNAYLTDFGVAIIASSSSHESNSIVGTPAYMSPEQWADKRITAASDIYSLGIVLYQMITGQVPYQADTPMAIMLKQLHDPIPPVSNFRKDIPDEVEQIIYKSLSLEPKLRFSRASEMAIAFSNALAKAKTHHPQTKKDLPDMQYSKQINPWVSGSFYLFSTVVLIVVLAIVSSNIPWYILPIVFIAGLLALTIIGALQLRNDKSLSEKNFINLMIETLKQLPLLSKLDSSKKSKTGEK